MSNYIKSNRTYLKTTSSFSLDHLHGHEKTHVIVPFHIYFWKDIEIIIILNNNFLNYIETYIYEWLQTIDFG